MFSNRVGEIHEFNSISQWRHVNGKDNPVDIVSRGCCPTKIGDYSLWWSGPSWLLLNSTEWPKQRNNFGQTCEDIFEERTVSFITHDANYVLSFLDRYSSLMKSIRVIVRDLQIMRQNEKKITGPISVYEEIMSLIIKFFSNE